MRLSVALSASKAIGTSELSSTQVRVLPGATRWPTGIHHDALPSTLHQSYVQMRQCPNACMLSIRRPQLTKTLCQPAVLLLTFRFAVVLLLSIGHNRRFSVILGAAELEQF